MGGEEEDSNEHPPEIHQITLKTERNICTRTQNEKRSKTKRKVNFGAFVFHYTYDNDDTFIHGNI